CKCAALDRIWVGRIQPQAGLPTRCAGRGLSRSSLWRWRSSLWRCGLDLWRTDSRVRILNRYSRGGYRLIKRDRRGRCRLRRDRRSRLNRDGSLWNRPGRDVQIDRGPGANVQRPDIQRRELLTPHDVGNQQKNDLVGNFFLLFFGKEIAENRNLPQERRARLG